MHTALILAALGAAMLASAQTSGTADSGGGASKIVPASGTEKWQLQYYYDKEDNSLAIADLQFPAPSEGFAIGSLTGRTGKSKAVRLTSRDGGANWAIEPVKDDFRSLFFLDTKTGWMVGSKKIFRTADGGQTWKQAKVPDKLLRVYFLDTAHGWAIGGNKSVLETTDGGETWKEVPAADEPKTTPAYTWYNCMVFATPRIGMISGFSRPPRPGDDSRFPNWMDPENPSREVPGMTIMLQTTDGGKTWRSSSASVFGRITEVRVLPDGTGLGLIEFQGSFHWPSEVLRLNWRAGKSTSVFRAENRAVTDIALLPDGSSLLAAIEVPGNNTGRAVPGKVKMLRSRDMSTWEEMKVDYRARARRVVLATSGKDIWAATDTGMVLKLASK